MATYPANIKCFLRCMGDELGLLMGSIPADIALMILVEKAASSEDELEHNLDIYDICSKKTALDPCESAAQVFKCGVVSSVTGMTNLIVNASASGAAAAQDSQILFGKLQAECATNYTCVADPAKVADRAGLVDGNDYFLQACGTVYYVVGSDKSTTGWQGAATYCCKFGMRLATISMDSMTCFSDAHAAKTVGYKHSGGFYINAMNMEAADFPVYCHDNSLVDTSTVDAIAGKYSNQIIYFNYFLAYPNAPGPNGFGYTDYSRIGYNFICEDV